MIYKKIQTYEYIPLPYTFIVKNLVQLINDLLEIPYDQILCFATFGVTNVYSNVPTDELIKIIDFMCDKHGNSGKLKHELVKVSHIIIKQNYFQFQNIFTYKKKNSLWELQLIQHFLKHTYNTLKIQLYISFY